jgi:hypothetical protein
MIAVYFQMPIVILGFQHSPFLLYNNISKTLIQTQIADKKQIDESFLILNEEMKISEQNDQSTSANDCCKYLGNNTRIPMGTNQTEYTSLISIMGKMGASKKRTGKKMWHEDEKKGIASTSVEKSGKKRKTYKMRKQGKKKENIVIKKGKKIENVVRCKQEMIKGSKNRKYITSLPTSSMPVSIPSIMPSNQPSHKQSKPQRKCHVLFSPKILE